MKDLDPPFSHGGTSTSTTSFTSNNSFLTNYLNKGGGGGNGGENINVENILPSLERTLSDIEIDELINHNDSNRFLRLIGSIAEELQYPGGTIGYILMDIILGEKLISNKKDKMDILKELNGSGDESTILHSWMNNVFSIPLNKFRSSLLKNNTLDNTTNQNLSLLQKILDKNWQSENPMITIRARYEILVSMIYCQEEINGYVNERKLRKKMKEEMMNVKIEEGKKNVTTSSSEYMSKVDPATMKKNDSGLSITSRISMISSGTSTITSPSSRNSITSSEIQKKEKMGGAVVIDMRSHDVPVLDPLHISIKERRSPKKKKSKQSKEEVKKTTPLSSIYTDEFLAGQDNSNQSLLMYFRTHQIDMIGLLYYATKAISYIGSHYTVLYEQESEGGLGNGPGNGMIGKARLRAHNLELSPSLLQRMKEEKCTPIGLLNLMLVENAVIVIKESIEKDREETASQSGASKTEQPSSSSSSSSSSDSSYPPPVSHHTSLMLTSLITLLAYRKNQIPIRKKEAILNDLVYYNNDTDSGGNNNNDSTTTLRRLTYRDVDWEVISKVCTDPGIYDYDVYESWFLQNDSTASAIVLNWKGEKKNVSDYESHRERQKRIIKSRIAEETGEDPIGPTALEELEKGIEEVDGITLRGKSSSTNGGVESSSRTRSSFFGRFFGY